MKLSAVFSAALLAVANAAVVRRGAPADANDVIRCAYSVHFDLGVDGLTIIKNHFNALGMSYVIRTSFSSDLANYVSFQLTGACSESDHVETISGAVSYSVVRALNRPAPLKVSAAPVQQNPEFIHTITGVNALRKNNGFTGKGITVAIIDSGVYYKHPALGGCLGKGCKVIGGYDFVGDVYDVNHPESAVSDSDPEDNCSEASHGTHVAGIVAADARNITTPGFVPAFEFTGVAPEASLLAYRVFSCDGKTGNDIVTTAIYQAAKDGADVLNLSLGGGPSFNDEDQDIAVDTISKAGHFVIASAGNDGASGIMTTGNPSNSRSALSIASFDNVAAPFSALTIDDESFIYSLGSLNPNFQDNQVLDIMINNIDADASDLMNDGTGQPRQNATGKALVIRWGDKSFGGSKARCDYAAKSGASACIIYVNDDTWFSIAGSAQIPSMLVTHSAGKALLAAVKAGKSPKVVFSATKKIMSPLPTAGTISSFSSAGLDIDLNFKPDIGGIGGNVLSTVSPHSAEFHKYTETYGLMSGTSMSGPYVAGVAALVLQARGKAIGFDQFRGFMLNQASPKKIYQRNETNSPAYQGAGLVNALYAATSKTLVLPASLALKDTENHVASNKLTIQNKDTVPVTYTFSYKDAATVNPFKTGDDFTQDATTITFTDDQHAQLSFSEKSITVAAGASAEITVQVVAPKVTVADTYPIYGGYIHIVASNQEDYEMSIPYAGVIGAYKNKSIWTRKSASLAARWGPTVGVPAESVTTGLFADRDFTPLTANAAINGTEGVPVLALAAHTSRFASIEVMYQGDASVLKAAGFNTSSPIFIQIVDEKAGAAGVSTFIPLQRNTYVDGQSVLAPVVYTFGGFAVDAVGNFTQLPAGMYKMKFSAVKNFAKVDDADRDEIITPVFELFYGAGGAKPAPSSSSTAATATGAASGSTATGASSERPTGVATSSGAAGASSSATYIPVVTSASSNAYVAPKPTASNLYKSSALAVAASFVSLVGGLLMF
ncbi:hypothetical protein CcCBS67573_g05377 [Chytriomyces confervae]|uniref:Peptidase S8/S53 domain-containing protein n=1 Tax=Chytriomyces confervae TaxID=246404 RepID=A0A507FCQ2_9FUNG|nr:hypothetical protein CcCBS67573_g05377 [Chytriomyces confervae]